MSTSLRTVVHNTLAICTAQYVLVVLCPSVCLSHAGIVSKRLDRSSCFGMDASCTPCCKEIRASPKIRAFRNFVKLLTSGHRILTGRIAPPLVALVEGESILKLRFRHDTLSHADKSAAPCLIHGSLGACTRVMSPQTKWHLDRFSRFCRALLCPTDRHTVSIGEICHTTLILSLAVHCQISL